MPRWKAAKLIQSQGKIEMSFTLKTAPGFGFSHDGISFTERTLETEDLILFLAELIRSRPVKGSFSIVGCGSFQFETKSPPDQPLDVAKVWGRATD